MTREEELEQALLEIMEALEDMAQLLVQSMGLPRTKAQEWVKSWRDQVDRLTTKTDQKPGHERIK